MNIFWKQTANKIIWNFFINIYETFLIYYSKNLYFKKFKKNEKIFINILILKFLAFYLRFVFTMRQPKP